MGASGMAWLARSGKSRFSAGGPVSYLSLYLLDFYFTVSIFILHNLLLLDSISFLLDSKSTFIRRSRAKHFGYPPFFDHKSATKPLTLFKMKRPSSERRFFLQSRDGNNSTQEIKRPKQHFEMNIIANIFTLLIAMNPHSFNLS